ncbi:MAG: hypothetical protein GF341_11005 [candidate division Zixibacteria bacterium]|nr:hypothetical protein [candidate division Zixibacteria bacterium]
MPLDYEIDPARRLVIARGHGVLTHDDLTQYQNAVWSKPEVQGFNEIVDITGVEAFKFESSRRVRELAVLATGMETTQGSRLAIVASEDSAYGLARMYKSYRDVQPGSTKDVSIFHAFDDAIRWLATDAPPDS